jgi:molybdate transport system ATP-binding protein
MIQARIRKQFPGGRDSAAFSLDLEFETVRDTTVLFGPSGSGKTLTLDSIAGFVRPDAGRILLDGSILFDAETGIHLPPQRRHCGYVFQSYALFPHMTLRQNLEFAAERQPKLERHRRVHDMLERFRLTGEAGRRPHELSGGQKQRCSIARALIAAPKVLLLDEPARGLDAPLRVELYDVLRQVASEFRTPIVLVTHDLEECLELGDSMLVLRDGRLIQSGPPPAVVREPANGDVARLLGIYTLLPAEVRALDPGRNMSRVAFQGVELTGPYLPGHLLGDRVTLCVRPETLRAMPLDGRPGPNQVPAELVRAVETPNGIRLEFAHGLAVETDRGTYDPAVAQWVVEFPRSVIRVV